MLINQKQCVSVANHNFISLSLDDYGTIPPIPTNRLSHLRVSKMKKVFDQAYSVGQIQTLTEVAIGVVTKDFEDPESKHKYKVNDVFVIDGNTRQHYWKMYPEKAKLTGDLTAKIHYLSSMDDVVYSYYPYNNAKSSEKASEILQGLARRYNWAPRQTVFVKGGYKTAMSWACTGVLDKPSLFEEFHYCFEELKLLDSVSKNSANTITNPNLKSLKSQAIIAACLIALKIYSNNLRMHDFIDRISNISKEELLTAMAKGELDPVQIIAIEYSGLSSQRGSNVSTGWLDGHAGSTKFASQQPQLDFLLHWIKKYIELPSLKYNFNKGIRPTSWENAWVEFIQDENEE